MTQYHSSLPLASVTFNFKAIDTDSLQVFSGVVWFKGLEIEAFSHIVLKEHANSYDTSNVNLIFDMIGVKAVRGIAAEISGWSIHQS